MDFRCLQRAISEEPSEINQARPRTTIRMIIVFPRDRRRALGSRVRMIVARGGEQTRKYYTAIYISRVRHAEGVNVGSTRANRAHWAIRATATRRLEPLSRLNPIA